MIFGFQADICKERARNDEMEAMDFTLAQVCGEQDLTQNVTQGLFQKLTVKGFGLICPHEDAFY